MSLTIDATHGTTLAKLETHLSQTNLQLDEAISLASSADEQSILSNARINECNTALTWKLRIYSLYKTLLCTSSW